MNSSIRERRPHRISINGVDVEHDVTLPKHAKQEGRDNKGANHWIRYLTALLILSAFIFLQEPSQLPNYDIVHHNLDNFQRERPPTAKLSSFTVDILSVASIEQQDLLHAQKRALASHISVRNFFNVTEADDADAHCHRNITWDHVYKTAEFCRSRKGRKLNDLTRFFAGQYARTQWLGKKKNPAGWLCAQPRPYAGLMKAYIHYKTTGEPLPNYFIIMDDDTYYNMELFQQNFEGLDSSEATFNAGCLVRWPIHQVNFTFPFGGFGSILSEGAMSNLFRSIKCPGWIDDARAAEDSAVCNRLRENNVKEFQYFANGMSLVELMYKYTTSEKYGDVAQWKTGFCMHSDWVIGYFVNYYNVSKHAADPFYKDVPHARMEAYKRSEIYRSGSGFCKNDPICKPGTEICHRATPEWLGTETERLKLKVPHKFRHIDDALQIHGPSPSPK